MSTRLAQRRRRRLLFISLCVATATLLICGGVVWLCNASFLKITSVTVSGENVVPTSSIEQAALHEIQGSYFGLFPRSNIFLYPKESIRKDILALYPTLKSIAIHASNFHTLTISVTERSPRALWCGTSTTDASDCVLLDTTGTAYAHAVQDSGQGFVKYYGPLQSGQLPKQFLTSAQFYSLSALVDTFAKKLAPDVITSVSVDQNNDVRLTASGNYDILFTLNDDSGKIFEHFSLILTVPPFKNTSLSLFHYIDLRFGDKVYYKVK
jgi:hypothetical protein